MSLEVVILNFHFSIETISLFIILFYIMSCVICINIHVSFKSLVNYSVHVGVMLLYILIIVFLLYSSETQKKITNLIMYQSDGV